MGFLDIDFLIFFLIFFVVYYLIKPQYRYVVIFFASYIFYGKSNYQLVFILGLITGLSYIGGILIDKTKKKSVCAIFYIINLLIFIGYKYTNYIIENIRSICGIFAIENFITCDTSNIILPIGLSFIIFQSCTYFSDVYKGKISAEKDVLKIGTFIAFFPTVLSGPIQKARILLPQLSSPKEFDFENAKKGTILFVWGMFEKLLVANKLAVIYQTVYNDFETYNSAYFLVAALSFSIYIYADFSSYSDMARGVAKLLGIEVGKNFNNPYLSVNTSEFWNRWHTSLNEWFIENLYIPFGGGRKGKRRKYFNMMVVFIISGLWHGAQNHYVLWGVINGVLAIGGQITKTQRMKIAEVLHISVNSKEAIIIKRIITATLITITWIPFTNGISDSLLIIQKIFSVNITDFFHPDMFIICGSIRASLVTAICTFLFCNIQFKRQDENSCYLKFNSYSDIAQCFCIALMITICFLGIFTANTNVNTQYMYFQF